MDKTRKDRKRCDACVIVCQRKRYKIKRIQNRDTISSQNRDDFERDLAMLKYFQEELMFRNKHYWDFLVKSFILTVTISILPIASQVMGIQIQEIPTASLWFFPFLGGCVALLSLFVLLKEARKMRSANEAKYRINRQYMSEKYHYDYYNDNIGKASTDKKGRKWLSYKIPFAVLTVEMMIILGVCHILYKSGIVVG